MTIPSLVHGTTRIGVAVNFLSLTLLFIFSGAIYAQEKPLLPMASDVVTNASSIAGMDETNTAPDLISGSSSDETRVPVNLHPFQLALPREHLLGTWFGLRTNLENWGITPTLTFVTDLAGNPVGGRSQGFYRD